MNRLACFILIISLEGLKVENAPDTTEYSQSQDPVSMISPSPSTINISESSSREIKAETNNPTTTSVTAKQKESNKPKSDCLINLGDNKELALWGIITLLFLICLLLLVIIMCMACKCCRGIRNNKKVMLNTPTTAWRNSANGGTSETDVMLKGCGSVKVEIETTPEEPEKPEEVDGKDAEVGNQVSTEENKNSANDTSENAPTQEADQSADTDLKTEALEKAE